MSMKEALILEFNERVFSESYERIFKCLSLIEEKDLWKSPSPKVPSIGNLILHLCGNARQWILSGIGGELDNRNREQEFVPQHNIRKAELIFLLQNLKVNLQTSLRKVKEEDLFKRKQIQGFATSNFSAIVHVLEHFSYHTGQITTLTKLFINRETNYYSGNLNQLNT